MRKKRKKRKKGPWMVRADIELAVQSAPFPGLSRARTVGLRLYKPLVRLQKSHIYWTYAAIAHIYCIWGNPRVTATAFCAEGRRWESQATLAPCARIVNALASTLAWPVG